MRCIVTIFLSLEWLQNKMQNSPPPPQPVLGCNILFLSKFLRSWSIFKEHLNEYLIKLEILIHIFDILTNIRPYCEILSAILAYWPKLSIFRSNFDTLWTNCSKVRPTFSRVWPKFSIFWPYWRYTTKFLILFELKSSDLDKNVYFG